MHQVQEQQDCFDFEVSQPLRLHQIIVINRLDYDEGAYHWPRQMLQHHDRGLCHLLPELVGPATFAVQLQLHAIYSGQLFHSQEQGQKRFHD